MSLINIRNGIIKALCQYLCVTIVPTDTDAPRPSYPFGTYKITSLLDAKTYSLTDEVIDRTGDFENAGCMASSTVRYDQHLLVTKKEQAKFTLSLSFYSEDDTLTHDLSTKAVDWFKFTGYLIHVNLGIAIVSVSSISDRSQSLIQSTESRLGFDVTIRYLHQVTKPLETIETHSLQNKKD